MTMIEPFLNRFTVTKDIGNGALDTKVSSDVDEDFKCVVEMLGGKTFRHGLYRVYRGDHIVQATESIWNVFPKKRNTCVAFGYDWLGRHFVIDRKRIAKQKPQILILEPGGGGVFEIPATIIDFHNTELVESPNEALALAFFNEWINLNIGIDIGFNQCVGYKVPLFLGGSDTVDNLELSDIDVYLELCAQLKAKI